MSLLKTKNLGISFGGLRAVDQVELDINDGELVGLIGFKWCWKDYNI